LPYDIMNTPHGKNDHRNKIDKEHLIELKHLRCLRTHEEWSQYEECVIKKSNG